MDKSPLKAMGVQKSQREGMLEGRKKEDWMSGLNQQFTKLSAVTGP